MNSEVMRGIAIGLETLVRGGDDLISFSGVDRATGKRLIVTIHNVEPPAQKRSTETTDIRASDLVLRLNVGHEPSASEEDRQRITVGDPLALIRQRRHDDCGIACLAMLSRRSYDEVYETISSIFGRRRSRTTDQTDILAAMDLLELRHAAGFRRVPPSGLFGVRRPAIVMINPSRDFSSWHWVVWDPAKRRVLDPKLKPYVRVRPIRYLAINP